MVVYIIVTFFAIDPHFHNTYTKSRYFLIWRKVNIIKWKYRKEMIKFSFTARLGSRQIFYQLRLRLLTFFPKRLLFFFQAAPATAPRSQKHPAPASQPCVQGYILRLFREGTGQKFKNSEEIWWSNWRKGKKGRKMKGKGEKEVKYVK